MAGVPAVLVVNELAVLVAGLSRLGDSRRDVTLLAAAALEAAPGRPIDITHPSLES